MLKIYSQCIGRPTRFSRDRMKALPGWAHPYDLMPGHPLPQSAA